MLKDTKCQMFREEKCSNKRNSRKKGCILQFQGNTVHQCRKDRQQTGA